MKTSPGLNSGTALHRFCNDDSNVPQGRAVVDRRVDVVTGVVEIDRAGLRGCGFALRGRSPSQLSRWREADRRRPCVDDLDRRDVRVEPVAKFPFVLVGVTIGDLE